VLGMLFQSEMFSKSIVVRNEHVVAFMSTLLARDGFMSSRLRIRGLRRRFRDRYE
jgi:hypothetical protein